MEVICYALQNYLKSHDWLCTSMSHDCSLHPKHVSEIKCLCPSTLNMSKRITKHVIILVATGPK